MSDEFGQVLSIISFLGCLSEEMVKSRPVHSIKASRLTIFWKSWKIRYQASRRRLHDKWHPDIQIPFLSGTKCPSDMQIGRRTSMLVAMYDVGSLI